jgi:hypothetical protein
MKVFRKVTVFIFAVALIYILYNILMERERINYARVMVPRLREAARSIPEIEITGYRWRNPRDEQLSVWVKVDVQGKGVIEVLNPTAENFTQDRPVQIMRIGSCVTSRGALFTLPVRSVVTDYEQLLAEARLKTNC